MNSQDKIAKLSGVVVLYEPDELVISRIDSYIEMLDKLFIIDNSKIENDYIKEHFLNDPNVQYIFNDINVGMAIALNIGAKLSLEAECSWLLTMDQDSSFTTDSLINYWAEFKHLSNVPEVGVIGINYDPNPSDSPGLNKYEKVNAVITSGSLINLDIWQLTGGFDEKLFIDEVDHEYCYRIIGKGFIVIKLNQVFLIHQMGNIKTAGYFGIFKVAERMIHSPLRIYYIVRNYLYVRKAFGAQLAEEFKKRDKQVNVILKNNLFFSGRFFATLKMITKGYLDFRKGVYGKYK